MVDRSSRDATTIERLAAWSLGHHPTFQDVLVRRQARLLILDSIGCAFAALSDSAMEPVLDLCRDLGGTAECAIIGGERTSVLNAVLANGALVRGLDLNDVMFAEKDGRLSVSGHRSDNIPVALAVGERLGSSMGAVIDCVALNYELYGRSRELIRASAPWDGATASAMVAAAMAGRLMGLDAVRQAHGIALAAARAPTPKIVRKGEISAAKNLANALVAQAGVQSALLAAKGVTGPLEVLDHEDGLHLVFEPALGLAKLWAPVPAPAAIMSAHVKSYPSIGTSQTAVTAAIRLHARLRPSLSRIAAIEVTMADVPDVRHQQADTSRRHPRSREAADHSFPFLVAVALCDGCLTVAQFSDERWLQPDIVDVMERVSFVVSDDLGRRAAGSMPARLRVVLDDGTELVEECLYPPGHSFPDKGLDRRVVIEKFNDMTASILNESRRAAIVDAILSVEESTPVAQLMGLLAIG